MSARPETKIDVGEDKANLIPVMSPNSTRAAYLSLVMSFIPILGLVIACVMRDQFKLKQAKAKTIFYVSLIIGVVMSLAGIILAIVLPLTL